MATREARGTVRAVGLGVLIGTAAYGIFLFLLLTTVGRACSSLARRAATAGQSWPAQPDGTQWRRQTPAPTLRRVGFKRGRRYSRTRIPGYGVVLNEVSRGRDAPLTDRDLRFLVGSLLGLVVFAVVVAMVAAVVF